MLPYSFWQRDPTSSGGIPRPERVVVVGGPGSGKTTLARQLAARLRCDHLELDGLWWTRPDWVHAHVADFVGRVDAAAPADGRWVADGNYLDEVAAVLWPRATTIVWMDPPRPVAFRRVVWRSVRRLARRELLWGTNRQSLGDITPASLWRLWRRWPTYGERIERLLATITPAATVVRLTSDGDVDRLRTELG